MGKCQHTHGKPNRWTQASTIINAAADFVSNAYWIGQLVDDTQEDPVDFALGLSRLALILGAIISVFITAGRAYSNKVINTHHQAPSSETQVPGSSPSVASSSASVTSSPATPEEAAERTQLVRVKPHLSKWQKLALVGDYISRIADKSTMSDLIFTIINEKQSLSVGVKWAIHGGLLILSSAASIAEVRTSYHTLKDANKLAAEDFDVFEYSEAELAKEPAQRADFWTLLNTGVEFVIDFTSTSYLLGTSFDIACGFEPSLLKIISPYGLATGSSLALLGAIGAAYAHKILNTLHQHSFSAQPLYDQAVAKKSLKFKDIIALIGDALTHTADTASPLVMVFDLATVKPLRWQEALARLGAMTVGGIAAVADVTTCRTAMFALRQSQAANVTELSEVSQLLNSEEPKPNYSLNF